MRDPATEELLALLDAYGERGETVSFVIPDMSPGDRCEMDTAQVLARVRRRVADHPGADHPGEPVVVDLTDLPPTPTDSSEQTLPGALPISLPVIPSDPQEPSA